MIRTNEDLARALARYNAARSFDIEDDIEFCSYLSEDDINRYRYGIMDRSSPPMGSYNSLMTSSVAAQTTPPHSTTIPDYYYNGSNSGSPRGQGGAILANNGSTYFYNAGGNVGMSGSNTPVRRRPVEIIDPNTGSNVSSPMNTSSNSGYYATPNTGGTVYYTANNSFNGSPMRGYSQYPVSVGGDSYVTPVRGRAW